MLVCVITGSRSWMPTEPIHKALAGAELLVAGDCPTGADAIALAYAKANDVMYAVLVADWKAHGNKAGPIRNQSIADRALAERVAGMEVRCFAFPIASSRGTIDCMKRLRDAGFDVKECRL